jgi:tRNA(Ile)-lysidine synthase TilS/MesJ
MAARMNRNLMTTLMKLLAVEKVLTGQNLRSKAEGKLKPTAK